MEIKIVKDKQAGGQLAFDLIKAGIQKNAKVLGLATGSSPITLYEAMVASDLDFSQMYSVNLDEYVGLAPDNDQSYHYFMQQHLFNQKPFKESFVPNGQAKDIAAEVDRYEQVIADHPVDIQILGIGRNGHIGFNEPGSSLTGKTHEVQLTQSTIDANARFFANKDDVPRQAISMGIGTIMKSKKIILLAYGEAKADAICQTVEGPVTTHVPASVLQNHDDAILILDEAAASKLQNK